MEQVFLEKLTGSHLVKKFPALYEIRKFISAFTRPRHLRLSWARSIQSRRPHPTSKRSILQTFSHLRLGLPSCLFPSGFHTKTLYVPLLSPLRATCPAQLILLDLITRIIFGEEYRLFSSSVCSFLHYHVTSSLLAPNILLSTPFSNTLSLRSSLNVRDQVSHQHRTTGKIIVIYTLIFIFSDSKMEDRRFRHPLVLLWHISLTMIFQFELPGQNLYYTPTTQNTKKGIPMSQGGRKRVRAPVKQI